VKKTISVRVHLESVEQVEADFPIYRSHDVGEHDRDVHYTRVEADGKGYTVHVQGGWGQDRETHIELSIETQRFEASSIDYALGRNFYKSDRQEFANAVAEARQMLDRFEALLNGDV
jgi:hypothetical protein